MKNTFGKRIAFGFKKGFGFLWREIKELFMEFYLL